MADNRDDEKSSLLPAALLRDKLCANHRLSKRAAKLLRRECDTLAAKLLVRAAVSTSGPLDAQDVWEALLENESYTWLVDQLGLWTSNLDSTEPSLPTDVPLPVPPPGLAPDSDLLPHLLWRRAPSASSTITTPQPLNEAFLEVASEELSADPAIGRPLQTAFLQQRHL